MQAETRNLAMVLLLIVSGLFVVSIFSKSRQRAALMGLATLGLGITNAAVRIGAK